MQNLLHQTNLASLLLQQKPYFQKNQSRINFIHKQAAAGKNPCISAWHQNSYDQNTNQYFHKHSSTQKQIKKERIKSFFSNIKLNSAAELNQLSERYRNRNKMSSLDNYEKSKTELFLPLNNTVIIFPKSRRQNRKLQNEDKILIQNLYQQRQKCNIVPKEILINTQVTISPNKERFQKNNHLAKNRSFADNNQTAKIYNPEYKAMKDLTRLKRRFSNPYHKKSSNLLQLEDNNNLKLFTLDEKFNLNHKKAFEYSSHFYFMNNEQQKSPIKNMSKTINTSPKFQNNLKCVKGYSFSKVKQQAKITHLDRMRFIQAHNIQLLGSTIARWKAQTQRKLQKNKEETE